jgi:XTP/dITP diphosphohydrolase
MKAVRYVIASANSGKLKEIRQVLASSGVEVLPQSEWSVPGVEETGGTFVENAILKARQAARYSDLPAISDDSGLEVDALGGAPGVRSARFAGIESDDAANNRLLLERMGGISPEDRSARFRCVMVCMRHPDDPAPLICQGIWEGRIVDIPRGRGGFGYDPLFMPETMDRTAAELSADEKNRMSHRGKALKALAEILRTYR